MKTDRDLIKQLNKLTREYPYLEKFNEKKYYNPKGYVEHETVMFNLARVLTSYQLYNVEYFKKDFTHRTSAIILHQCHQQGFSSYWLKDDLFEAFNKTQTPSKLREFKKVVPCGVLFFPCKLKSPNGQFLKWICFYHREVGERILPLKINDFTLDIETVHQSTLSWFTVLDNGTQYVINRIIELVDNNFSYDTENLFIDNTITDEDKLQEIETEATFTQKVTDLLIQTLLYLQLKPDLIGEQLLPPAGTQSVIIAKKNSKLSPNILGKDYQVKRERTVKSADSVVSGRQSPIAHWRRGFYKWQPFGTRENPQHKLIWIEPVLVNR